MSTFDVSTQAYRRRLFSDTLAEVALGLLDIASKSQGYVISIELRLPIELGFEPLSGELTGDLPLYRCATAFDAPPSEVMLTLEEMKL